MIYTFYPEYHNFTLFFCIHIIYSFRSLIIGFVFGCTKSVRSKIKNKFNSKNSINTTHSEYLDRQFDGARESGGNISNISHELNNFEMFNECDNRSNYSIRKD